MGAMYQAAGVAVAFCTVAVPLRPTMGQGLKVAVSVTDSETGGLFQSGFAAALRSLGDIAVVGETEDPDYVLNAVVLCSKRDDCKNTPSYSVALRVYEPMHRSTASWIASIATPRPVGAITTQRSLELDSLGARIWPFLEGYEKTNGTWVAIWGRQRYEQAMREFIREIASGCLDKFRALHRAFASSDTASWTNYATYVKSRKWMC